HVCLTCVLSAPCLVLIVFFFSSSRHHLYLHSFPTRRSSDLAFCRAGFLISSTSTLSKQSSGGGRPKVALYQPRLIAPERHGCACSINREGASMKFSTLANTRRFCEGATNPAWSGVHWKESHSLRRTN